MAARTPRRSFATPFVVIIAAAPGCYVRSAPPASQPQPQAQPTQPTQPTPSDSHPVVISNPPRPQPQPQPQPEPQPPPNPSVVMNPPRPTGPAAGTSWHVYKTKDGCEAIVNVQCPAGATCNPPPPSKIDCPSGIVMNKPITIIAETDGTCQVEREPMHCPPHAMCNPPRPQTVTCPK